MNAPSHPTPASRRHLTFHGALLLIVTLTLNLCPARVLAQAGTGSITGAVSNQSTRLFLDRAEIKIDGTTRAVLTDRDGTYDFTGLAPGAYNLVVSYTGLDAEQRTVNVTAGAKATQDFALTSGIYKLGAFTVAAEIEGNAAAVNQQKKSDVFIQAISTDTLGIVPDGNIGEFLRYVPGLQVNFSNADASTVSMRGQDPESTLFTFDGQIPAAAGTPPRSSTGSSDASSRAFEFSSATKCLTKQWSSGAGLFSQHPQQIARGISHLRVWVIQRCDGDRQSLRRWSLNIRKAMQRLHPDRCVRIT